VEIEVFKLQTFLSFCFLVIVICASIALSPCHHYAGCGVKGLRARRKPFESVCQPLFSHG
jgi:hypothetical protein